MNRKKTTKIKFKGDSVQSEKVVRYSQLGPLSSRAAMAQTAIQVPTN